MRTAPRSAATNRRGARAIVASGIPFPQSSNRIKRSTVETESARRRITAAGGSARENGELGPFGRLDPRDHPGVLRMWGEPRWPCGGWLDVDQEFDIQRFSDP